MAKSGVTCCAKVLDEFKKLAEKKQYRYIVFKISDDKKIIEVEKTGDSCKTFEDLKKDLQDKCRYAVFDLCFETKGEKQKREKIIFISHIPDNSEAPGIGQEKMLYSSSKKALTEKLGSGCLHASFHYGDHSDIDLDTIIEEMQTRFK